MKKLIVSAIAVGVMSVSAMAGYFENATVDAIKVRADGTVAVVVTAQGASVPSLFNMSTATADAKKAMLAALLTAKTTSGKANIRFSNGAITEVAY